MKVFFSTDLHGRFDRYNKLFDLICAQTPNLVLLGGDLLPHGMARQSPEDPGYHDFLHDFLRPGLESMLLKMGRQAPRILAILGNDDPAREVEGMEDLESLGLLEYIHMKTVDAGPYTITGYAFVPPTPFLLKDWEKYDVSRYVDPGCVPPTEGYRSIHAAYDTEYSTIAADLENLTSHLDMDKAILLFHSPPYKTRLDRAALDNQFVDHVPLDVHVGSMAIERFIRNRQPYLSLHGHIHESSTLTGSWWDQIGRTRMFNAAWEKKDLSVIAFDPADLASAERWLM